MGTILSTAKKTPPPVAVAAKPVPPKSPLPEDFILGQEYKDVTDDFTLGKAIRNGKFAAIYICKEKSTGKKYACKKIPKRKLVTKYQKENLKREVRIMEYLQDLEYFVQLKGAYEDPKCVHLVMEYCEGGDLYDKMKSKGRYSEKVAAQILCSIMKVVYCLHFMGIMHRDLKPENFMLAKKAACPCFPDYSMLKAIDFGLSAFIDEGKPKKEKVGTAFYVAPEVLSEHAAYGEKIDIWSAGVILYMLLTGVPPFNGENDRGIFSTVKEATPDMEKCPWPLISKNAKSLMKAMLSLKPEKRPTADVVLNDQWLKDNGVATENEIKYELEKMVLKRMKHFGHMHIFKKLTLKTLKEIKPPEEINGLRALFKSFDPIEKQGISCENLEETFVRIGSNLGPEDAKLIVEAVDTDGNGYIDFDEFITAVGNFRRYESQDLIKCFRHFDKDAKGFLRKGDVESALEHEGYNMEVYDIAEIMSNVDKDNDDKISFKEFCVMIRS